MVLSGVGFWLECLYQLFTYSWLGMRVCFGSTKNYLNFFGIAICLLNLVHILMGECLSLMNSDGLKYLEVLRILLSFYFTIYFDQRFIRNLKQKIGHCFHNGIESVITDVAGSMRQHVRQEQINNILPWLFKHPRFRKQEYFAVVVRISMIWAKHLSLLFLSSRYL